MVSILITTIPVAATLLLGMSDTRKERSAAELELRLYEKLEPTSIEADIVRRAFRSRISGWNRSKLMPRNLRAFRMLAMVYLLIGFMITISAMIAMAIRESHKLQLEIAEASGDQVALLLAQAQITYWRDFSEGATLLSAGTVSLATCIVVLYLVRWRQWRGRRVEHTKAHGAPLLRGCASEASEPSGDGQLENGQPELPPSRSWLAAKKLTPYVFALLLLAGLARSRRPDGSSSA